MNKLHIVKTNKSVFEDVWKFKKLSELRYDDRDYRIGDVLKQMEYLPRKKQYTGRYVLGEITAITRVAHWIEGVDINWVILHLSPDGLERGNDE